MKISKPFSTHYIVFNNEQKFHCGACGLSITGIDLVEIDTKAKAHLAEVSQQKRNILLFIIAAGTIVATVLLLVLK